MLFQLGMLLQSGQLELLSVDNTTKIRSPKLMRSSVKSQKWKNKSSQLKHTWLKWKRMKQMLLKVLAESNTLMPCCNSNFGKNKNSLKRCNRIRNQRSTRILKIWCKVSQGFRKKQIPWDRLLKILRSLINLNHPLAALFSERIQEIFKVG